MLVGLAVGAAVAAVAVAIAFWFLSAPRPTFPNRDISAVPDGGNVENGKLIFTAADCASCHASPGQSNRLRLGGGLALASPFGVLRVPNISPDPRDGIGRWRTVDLANALLSGVSPDGKHYYPALPYTSYSHMRLSDIRDLMAYLRTLPPVSGRPPPHDLPSRSTSAASSGFGSCCTSNQAQSHPTRVAARPGTVAAISWRRYPTVPSATPLATCSEPSNRKRATPVEKTRRVLVSSPTLPPVDCRIGRKRNGSGFSSPVRPRTCASSALRWSKY